MTGDFISDSPPSRVSPQGGGSRHPQPDGPSLETGMPFSWFLRTWVRAATSCRWRSTAEAHSIASGFCKLGLSAEGRG